MDGPCSLGVGLCLGKWIKTSGFGVLRERSLLLLHQRGVFLGVPVAGCHLEMLTVGAARHHVGAAAG